MRNLKKFLALVLALMMVVSVMVTVSAADFSSTPDGTDFNDDAAITGKYDEAVQVLEGLNVLQGDEAGNLNPKEPIARSEMAAIAYRIMTGKTETKSPDIYAGSKFTDVPANHWAKGFIDYCHDAKLIVGHPGGAFKPDDTIIGYDVITILLRALGYDKNGEFQGAGYEANAAKYAQDAGIIDNISSNELSKPATREMVAEMTFRAIAKTSMVCQTVYPTVGYAPVDGYGVTGTHAGMTLGWKVFGLYGGLSKGHDTTATKPMATYIAAYNYERMTTRLDADVDGKYDAPKATWNYNGGTIDVNFAPVATYTDSVDEGTVYAATGLGSGLVGSDVDVEAYNVDGVAPSVKLTDVDYKSTTKLAGSGNGILTEVYVADGLVFITSVTTYVDTVKSEYKAPTGTPGTATAMALTTDTATFDYSAVAEVSDAQKATLAALEEDDVVIYHKYESSAGIRIDYTTVHAVEPTSVTVTDTYDKTTAGASYFMVGATKYEYTEHYWTGNFYLNNKIMDRDDKSDQVICSANQVLYLDDYGYVIYHELPASAAKETGYMVVTSGKDVTQVAANRWVLNFTGYDAKGNPITLQGGVNQAYYANETAASSAFKFENRGIYYYEKDSATGYYKLVASNGKIYTGSSYSIAAGDADALLGGGGYLNDETVFVIEAYDGTGAENGYKVVTGFKNIQDMIDRSGVPNTIGGKENYEYKYTMSVDSNGTTIDLVFVKGAKETPQVPVAATTDKYVYLLDATPLQKYTTYDAHSVVWQGAATTLNFAMGNIYNDGTSSATAGNFYEVATNVYGYYEIAGGRTAVTTGTVTYLAPGVVSVNGTVTTLADNYVIYSIGSDGSVKSIAAKDIGASANGFVAATNTFGYATVIYVK